MLDALGRHDEADAEIRRALELEPLSLPINWFYGIHLYVIRDYEASVLQLRKTVELDPSFVNGQISLGDALVLNGKFAEAFEQLAKQQELLGKPAKAAFIRETCAGLSWQECWRTLTAGNSSVELSPFVRARMFAELGEKDNAFGELEKAYEVREAPFLRLKVDPRLDGLRADPRYADLVKKVGFPE
jgi:tetratricopeptide (TPR) repeat protein